VKRALVPVPPEKPPVVAPPPPAHVDTTPAAI